ncbi:MAG TPA: hypothetical protein HPQ03_16925 [Deltaproteobacteria bacterium]|nr:hypothetical protein [Deltaproteobacteria bacterium]
MKIFRQFVFVLFPSLILMSCVTGGDVITEKSIGGGELEGIGETELARIEEIKEEKRKREKADINLEHVMEGTPNYSVAEYLSLHPDANNPMARDYRVGGYDVLSITVYEEADLSRESIRISAEGYISFPLIGRIRVDTLTTSEIENLIAEKLAAGQYLLDAHVSISVVDFKSKQFMVLGSVKEPGTYPLQAKERVLDAISRAGGIDFEQGGKQGVVIRTENPNTDREKKVVIQIEISDLLKGGDQLSNLLLADKDLLYVPKADFYYVIGQVKEPGKYPYQEKDITLVEAISTAGGFTQIAARNRTRIIRMENGVEKIIEVKVDTITKAGKKLHDISIHPGDVIVVPESFF